MGSLGVGHDNVLRDSLYAALECVLPYRFRFGNHAETRMAAFSYVEGWQNRYGRHPRLGYLCRWRSKGDTTRYRSGKALSRPPRRGNSAEIAECAGADRG